MKTIENLQITKFFDVKTPVGINQRGESLDNYSIGIDLYFPRFTKEFFNALMEANKKLYPEINYSVVPANNFTKETEYIAICDGEDLLAKIYQYTDLETSETSSKGRMIFIDGMLQIPTGIGMNIPAWAWAELRTKSSNYQLGWSEVHGTIDMNYTYGMGVQMLICKDNLEIQSDQKFAQIVFHEAVPVLNIEEVSQSDWNNNQEIINKRTKRIGGFGTTGKFDTEESVKDENQKC